MTTSRISRCLVLLSVLTIAAPATWAYEKDIHYSATLAIAIAVGWSPAEARVIASANQGMDENKSTIAALEFDVISSTPNMINGEPYYVRGPIHQAEKNFRLHCFSREPDSPGKVNQYVTKTFNDHFHGFNTALQNDARTTPKTVPWIDTLVALGMTLHCQQDALSHNNYGGFCPKNSTQSYSGNCYGHLKDSALHRHHRPRKASNPDHPAVRVADDLIAALDTTSRFLASARNDYAMHLPLASQGPKLARKDIEVLARLLHDPNTLKLADEERMQCNHEVIAAWLFQVHQRSGLTPQALAKHPVSGKCAAAFPALFPSSARMRLPAPSYPQLTDKAQAKRAGPGTYLAVDAKSMADLKIEEIAHERHDCNPIECTYSYKVRVSNLSQFRSATGYLLLGVVPVNDKSPGFGIKVPLEPLAPGAQTEIPAHTRGPTKSEYIVYTDIQPGPDQAPEWRDANVNNDSGTCLVTEGKIVESGPKSSDSPEDGHNPLCRNLPKKK